MLKGGQREALGGSLAAGTLMETRFRLEDQRREKEREGWRWGLRQDCQAGWNLWNHTILQSVFFCAPLLPPAPKRQLQPKNCMSTTLLFLLRVPYEVESGGNMCTIPTNDVLSVFYTKVFSCGVSSLAFDLVVNAAHACPLRLRI